MSRVAKTKTPYLIEDVLGPGLRVVFCGTALGRASAAARAYYAHRQNLFWQVLHEVGLTSAERPLEPREYPRVLDFGIGLTDLCKYASGNDNDLPRGAFDVAALSDKINRYRPHILAFTSKTAGRAFCGGSAELGWQAPFAFGTRVYVLPSTSPTARWQWNETRAHWRILAQAVPALKAGLT